jgi:dTDP-D-glucose 4,6-dehydratase
MLQEPKELKVYGDGKNKIPLIHIKDLAEFAVKIVEKTPVGLLENYLFAIDQYPKITQKKIIQSISKGLGTG